MSAAQAIASRRFLKAMGSMVEDEQRLNEVLEYIESIKIRPLSEQITEGELAKNGMPLHQAMNQLRLKILTTYS